MPTLLITGANRGIGLELTRQYLEGGWNVLACCRQPDQADELKQLQSDNTMLSIHSVDVGNEQSIKQLAEELKGKSIDVLLNNAGIYGGSGNKLGSITSDQWLEVFKVNTIGPLLMAQVFLDQVASSDKKTIATISSKVGSIEDNQSGSNYMYRSSKTAVNQAMKSLSIDASGLGIKAVVLHPGWVLTDMGGPNALINTQQSASGLKAVLDNLKMEQSGQFINYDGSEIPW
ncbi:SDR family oxidoreductase [Porticoccaceae bacterium LTM1]|nr:SDR family oxidoreductase [Porticoccaceae bacterium LTM1]